MCYKKSHHSLASPDEQLMVKVVIAIIFQNSARLVDTEVPAGPWVTQTRHRFKEAWVKAPERRKSQISMQANSKLGAGAGRSMHMLNSGCASSEDWHLVWELLGLILLF